MAQCDISAEHGAHGDDDKLKDRHKSLAGVVKGVHANLRNKYRQSGNIESVWQEHCQNDLLLLEYADAMHHLATEIWTKNPETRIDWCQQTCLEYFLGGGLQKVLDKDSRRQRYRRRQDKTASRVSRPRSKSEERPMAEDLNYYGVSGGAVPVIQVLSSSASQIRPYPRLRGSDLGQARVDFRHPPKHATGLLSPGRASGLSSKMDEVPSSPETDSNSWQHHSQDSSCTPDTNTSRGPEFNGCPESRNGAEYSQPNSRVDAAASSVDTSVGSVTSGGAGGCPSPNEQDLIFGLPDGMDVEQTVPYRLSQQYNSITLPFRGKIRLLDVGSCFNPFQQCEEFLTVGLDISPAVESVFCSDFLYLEVTKPLQLASDSIGAFLHALRSPVERLPGECFHVVVFSLLLEYFPCAYQRWVCCQKAHQLLAMNGTLVIITPDSHHQNRNAPMLRSWKVAIESLGFLRWRYIKQEHLHCMVFRKVTRELPTGPLVPEVGPDMLYIPQDFNEPEEQDSDKLGAYLFGSVPPSDEEQLFLKNNFQELPDFDSL